MDLDEPFGMLLFLCIFEVLGGAALGAAFRSLARRDLSGLFFLIWGGGFAGIPFLIGAITFLSAQQLVYLYAQTFVLLTVIVTVALLPADFLQGHAAGEGRAVAGAVLTMIGGAVVLMNLRAGLGLGLLIGGFLALVGVLLFIRAAMGVLRSA